VVPTLFPTASCSNHHFQGPLFACLRRFAGFIHLSDNQSMQEAITRDPEVMHGAPVFRGTRVPVQTLFDYLENGDSLDEFLEGFPTISRELAIQVLEECKELRLARI
jgi:uncharacterized protein (DUF433 family)